MVLSLLESLTVPIVVSLNGMLMACRQLKIESYKRHVVVCLVLL